MKRTKKRLLSFMLGLTAICTAFGLTACDSESGGKENMFGHVYDKEVVTDTYLKSKATCTQKAVYYKSCECGAVGEETFEYGETVPHEYHGVVTNPTCTEQGYTTYTCDCGESYVGDYVNAKGHTIVNGVCTVCGEGETEQTPSVGLEYTLLPDENSYSVTGIGTCQDANIVIPATYNNLPVTTIGDDAFYRCTNLTSVVIPDSVTTIGGLVFCYCNNLTSVSIGNSVTVIGYYAFYYCYNLQDIQFTGTVEEWNAISKGANWNDNVPAIKVVCLEYNKVVCLKAHTYTTVVTNPTCTEQGYTTYTCDCGDSYVSDYVNAKGHTTTVNGVCTVCGEQTLSEGLIYTLSSNGNSYSVTGIGTCQDTNLVIPATYNNLPVTAIGNHAFEDCYSLTSVVILDGVTTIGRNAFEDCYRLTSVVIPDSVTTIGGWGFKDCYRLTSIEVAEDNVNYKDIDGNLYSKDGTTLIQYAIGKTATSFTIPDGVTTIGGYAFCDCDSLKSVIIPDNVYYRFYDFRNVTITIGNYAFYDCDSLTNVVIPDSVKYYNGVIRIGSYTFADCDSLTNVVIPGIHDNGVITIGDSAFRDCNNLTSVSIGNSVTTIGDWAFAYCNNLTSIVIPYNVTMIGEHAFENCESLINAIIENGTIGEQAFYNCNSLTSITIENGTIGDYAFCDCDNLTSVSIGNSVTAIGDYAFCDCDNLTSVSIGNGVTTIGSYVFYGCDNLTNVSIGNGVTTIGSYVFYGCDNLTSVSIGNSVTTIASYAFYYCDSLTNIEVAEDNTAYKDIDGNLYSKDGTTLIQYAKGKTATSFTIPDSVTTIGSSAFRDCDNLTNIVIPDSVTVIGDSAFYYCTSLTNVIIPDSVTVIGDSAFYRCNSLTSVIIPDSVTTIEDDAFRYCDSLTNVSIGNSVTAIGSCAFYYCTSLTNVSIGNSVTTIGGYAFSSCISLQDIQFTGTVEEWNAISKDAFWKYNVPATKVVCLDGEVEL